MRGTILHADEAPAWNDLHARYEMRRIDHQAAYSLNGASTNWAESYFSRLRRGEAGHHHHIAGPYLLRFAQEAAWREGNRRVPNGEAGAGAQEVGGLQRLLAAACKIIARCQLVRLARSGNLGDRLREEVV
jgi:hypothetical protein